MLKFRHPFHDRESRITATTGKPPVIRNDLDYSKKLGVDFLKDYHEGKLRYLDGTLYIQPFPKLSSTEARLVGTRFEIKDYGHHRDYEDRFAYYNLVRSIGMFRNIKSNVNIGFDLCGDCALEYKIWNDYAEKYGQEFTIDWVQRLIDITGQKLIHNNHGEKFAPLTLEKYKEDYKTKTLETERKRGPPKSKTVPYKGYKKHPEMFFK
jgi:hypothetical protein